MLADNLQGTILAEARAMGDVDGSAGHRNTESREDILVEKIRQHFQSEDKRLTESCNSTATKFRQEVHNFENAVNSARQSSRNDMQAVAGQLDVTNHANFRTLHDRMVKHYPNLDSVDLAEEPKKSAIFLVGLVLLLFVLESALNAFLFKEGSGLGWFGGALEAALVSLGNIMMGLIFGLIAAAVWHRHFSHRRLVWPVVGSWILIALSFNLCALHQRLVFVDKGEGAKFWESVSERGFFTLGGDWHSVVLFIIGIVVALVSTYEGWTLIDPYRPLRRLKKECDNVENKSQQRARKIGEDKESVLHAQRQKANEEYESATATLHEVEGAEQELPDQFARCVSTALGAYRQAWDAAYIGENPQWRSPEQVIQENRGFSVSHRMRQAIATLRECIAEFKALLESVTEKMHSSVGEINLLVDDTCKNIRHRLETAAGWVRIVPASAQFGG